EHLGLEALAAARLARHEHVGEEHHLHEHGARAVAGVAAAARHVEREGARRAAPPTPRGRAPPPPARRGAAWPRAGRRGASRAGGTARRAPGWTSPIPTRRSRP